MDLKGSHILFLSAYFFGYNQEICKILQSAGAHVDYYDERPGNSFLIKALIRIHPALLQKYTRKYHDRILRETANKKYDYILIIKAESISVNSLQKLKAAHPEAKMTLYLWDSLSNFRQGVQKLPLFDKVSSFDKEDCQKYHMEFRPLFYLPHYENISDSTQERDLDILFIGTMHSDRYLFLQQIKTQAIALGYSVYYYLFFMSRLLYYKMKWANRALKNSKRQDFQFSPLSQEQIIRLFERSNTIIDIQHPRQTGLTMRAIETLGAKRKLITTNPHIRTYDFFHENNILIIDRQNPRIDPSFLDKPYQPLSPEIYRQYSVQEWLKTLLTF